MEYRDGRNTPVRFSCKREKLFFDLPVCYNKTVCGKKYNNYSKGAEYAQA
jgi:hypothetical protein